MNAAQINLVLSGAILMGYLVAMLFFCRFWRLTRDRLFGLFALAFTLMALERLVLLVLGTTNELTPYAYSLRLAAFGLIFVGIADKNRSR